VCVSVCVRARVWSILTASLCAQKERWAAASGFSATQKKVSVAEQAEVVVLCCAIKPLCGWNLQVLPRCPSQCQKNYRNVY
jgi:acyl-CoA oxidase